MTALKLLKLLMVLMVLMVLSFVPKPSGACKSGVQQWQRSWFWGAWGSNLSQWWWALTDCQQSALDSLDLQTVDRRDALLAVHHLILVDGKHLRKGPALALVVACLYAVLHPFNLRVLSGRKL